MNRDGRRTEFQFVEKNHATKMDAKQEDVADVKRERC
jgi:hypothetical protein